MFKLLSVVEGWVVVVKIFNCVVLKVDALVAGLLEEILGVVVLLLLVVVVLGLGEVVLLDDEALIDVSNGSELF